MNKKTIVLTAFVLTKFVLQYQLINPEYDLHRDEYLHLDQGSHLAWGYLSVPPFTSWVSWLIQLLGNSEFWVQFFPALFGALTLIMVWKTITTLGGDLFAHILGATCILFSVLLRLNTLYQPNSFDVLAWITVCYCLIRYQQSEQGKWLNLGAVAFALGFLNKYNVLFLAMGCAPALLIIPARKVFTQKALYIAVLLALVLVLPNLLWQYHNHFPAIHHMEVLTRTQLVNVTRGDFLRSQLLFNIGAVHVIVAGLLALLLYKPFQKHRSFFWTLLFTLAIFMYFRAKDYYAIGLYPVYIAFGAVYLTAVFPVPRRKVVYAFAILIPLLLFIPLYHRAFPNKSPQYIIAHTEKYKRWGLLRWEDGKDHPLPQDFADMLGWRELAHKVDSVYSMLPDTSATLVLCDNYGQAGAINFYTKKGIRAVSFNADYINWFQLDKPYQNVIRVKDYEGKSTELAETSPFFHGSKEAAEVTNPLAREYGTTIFLFTGAKVDIRPRLSQEIEEVKSEWR